MRIVYQIENPAAEINESQQRAIQNSAGYPLLTGFSISLAEKNKNIPPVKFAKLVKAMGCISCIYLATTIFVDAPTRLDMSRRRTPI